MDGDLIAAINRASDLIAEANQALRDAAASLDVLERQRHAMTAYVAIFYLDRLCRRHPAIVIKEMESFKADLIMVQEATRARSLELYGRLI